MTEQEEDEELMTDANDIESEDEIITRFDASPWCKSILFCLKSKFYFVKYLGSSFKYSLILHSI